jgi:2'-5' RNA ligase
VDDAREPELRAALSQAAAAGHARGVTVHIAGFGVFPDFRRPRIFWAGVEPDPALELLQHRVEQVFAPLGFPTEARPFRPHVALGRGDFTGLEGSLTNIAFDATALVPDLDLMQSTLQSGGAVYEVKHRERLS